MDAAPSRTYTPTDQSLISACLAGDKVAWTTLLDRYERLIYSVPVRYGLSESQANDIFQNVCIIVLERLEQLRDESRLAGWLVTVTRRECWKEMRRRDAPGSDEPDSVIANQIDSADSVEDTVAQWESWSAVREALRHIGERCRDLLHRLYYVQPQPSYQEIAESLDIAVGSIGPTRARCLKKLHDVMGGQAFRVE
jgi:RNA polymerase sigma factor (sigma-70 family)